MNKTEDQVRSIAEKILGFNIVEAGVNQGVGQITTFNQLGLMEYLTSRMVGICQKIKHCLLLF